MTSIDFHFNTPDRLHYTCRLIRKISQSAMITPSSPLVVFCTDKARLGTFDDLLWGFSPTEFIGHAKAGEPHANQNAVILADAEHTLPAHHLLINLDDEPPPFFSRFTRLFEIVSTEESDREKARARFSFYRDRGYALTRHDLAKSGA